MKLEWTPEGYALALARWGRLLLREDADRLRQAQEVWDRLQIWAAEAAEAGHFLPLPYVWEAFALSPEQRQFLALVMLCRQDRQFRAALAELDPGWGGAPDGELLLQLLTGQQMPGRPWRAALAPEGALWKYCLVPNREGLMYPVRRLEAFVLEECYEPEGITGLELCQPEVCRLSAQQEELVQRMEDYLRSGRGERTTFLLWGQPGAGRRTLAMALAVRLGQPLLMVQGRLLGDEDFCSSVLRELELQRCPVCIHEPEAWLVQEDAEEVLTELLTQCARYGCGFVTARQKWSPHGEHDCWRTLAIGLGLPGLSQSSELWRQLMERYPFAPGQEPDVLAGKYRMTPGQIRRAVEAAHAEARWRGRTHIDPECLALGCRAQLRHGLSQKARRVEAVFGWEDLILPTASKKLLRSACDQIRYRPQVYENWGFGRKLPYGAGLSMLFSGPPGTGKTMAAQIVASELGLELYKVELSAVVSKYVGETEQNLNQIFREAARSQAVLFFDEADVLFGKRTEVKDAHDKYNNMEAAYLLQKMEEYDGVSVLATNFLQNFDEAFKRRIRFIIEFPFPSAPYRLRLWQSVFPPQTPVSSDVDWEFLAEHFELSGSGIKNTAVNAAFLAARAGVSVGMEQILTALKREIFKNGKHLSREDFGAYYMLLEDGYGGI